MSQDPYHSSLGRWPRYVLLGAIMASCALVLGYIITFYTRQDPLREMMILGAILFGTGGSIMSEALRLTPNWHKGIKRTGPYMRRAFLWSFLTPALFISTTPIPIGLGGLYLLITGQFFLFTLALFLLALFSWMYSISVNISQRQKNPLLTQAAMWMAMTGGIASIGAPVLPILFQIG